MRQALVESKFLHDFDALYPQVAFRGIRRFPKGGQTPYAFALRIAFAGEDVECDLLCAVLSDGHPREIKQFIDGLAADADSPELPGGLPVLVVPYLGDESRALCREASVGCLDLAGNAMLKTDRVYFEIAGKRNRHPRKKAIRSPFEGKAERIIRRLLLEPERRWRMRDLADDAQVSLGLASMVTSRLTEDGLATKSRSGFDLQNPGAVLDMWKETYDLKTSQLHALRSWVTLPTLITRLAESKRRLGPDYALTLWSGANCLMEDETESPHLALYWSGAPDELTRTLRLQEESGRSYVFVFEPYDECALWGAKEAENGLRVVHPLQLYLDLGCGDKQEVSLAQRLRTRLLTF